MSDLENSETESQRLTAAISVQETSVSNGIASQINSIVDNDPQLNRRALISKAKDAVIQLEQKREDYRVALLKVNEDIKTDLDTFQNKKMADFKNMMFAFVLAQKEYHQKSLDAWMLARESIEEN